MIAKKVLASKVYRNYSRIVDELNTNGAVAEWMRQNKGKVPVFKHRYDLYRYVNDVICGSDPIDYFEFGVYQGDSLREWVTLNRQKGSRFFGFDSFEGLPEDWNHANPMGKFSLGGQLPDIGDDRVRLVKGWFQQTLRSLLADFRPQARLVIHNDSDLHSSTLFTLTAMDRIIVPGTVLIFDEFTSPLHEFRAFHEYVAAYMKNVELVCTAGDYASQAAFIFK
jgi:O-methyltransferase